MRCHIFVFSVDIFADIAYNGLKIGDILEDVG